MVNTTPLPSVGLTGHALTRKAVRFGNDAANNNGGTPADGANVPVVASPPPILPRPAASPDPTPVQTPIKAPIRKWPLAAALLAGILATLGVGAVARHFSGGGGEHGIVSPDHGSHGGPAKGGHGDDDHGKAGGHDDGHGAVDKGHGAGPVDKAPPAKGFVRISGPIRAVGSTDPLFESPEKVPSDVQFVISDLSGNNYLLVGLNDQQRTRLWNEPTYSAVAQGRIEEGESTFTNDGETITAKKLRVDNFKYSNND